VQSLTSTLPYKGWAAKTLDPLRQEAISATAPQLPRKRLRSIPARVRHSEGWYNPVPGSVYPPCKTLKLCSLVLLVVNRSLGLTVYC